jgi:hypothetical protein
MSTASLNATVMPPPVSGCRIFSASPRRIIPGVLFVDAGKSELGIDLKPPFSIASAKDGCTDLGKEGKTTFFRCAFTPPLATEAVGV